MSYEKGKGLAVVCRWDAKQFGCDENTSKDISNHWFVLHVLDEDDMEDPEEMLAFCRVNCNVPVYLELIDYYCLEGNEMVGICKTFWLKLIQRKWKKVYAKRMRILKERQQIHSILHRERYGCWPQHLNAIPSLVGMMA